MSVNAKWIDGYQSVLDNGRSHSVVADLPGGKDGEDMGATALELTNMSLAGCVSTIFMVVANKMRIDVENLEVKVDTENPDEAPTVTEAEIEVQVESKENQDKLEKCLKQTMNTCPVGNLYEQAGVDITHNLIKL